MMDRISVAKRIYAAANIRGRFRLRSGQVSDEYFDKYLFEAQPDLLRAIAEQMAVLIPTGVDALAGLEMASGGQVIESARELHELGATVTDVLCVIDRE